jgi:hypothetical protein
LGEIHGAVIGCRSPEMMMCFDDFEVWLDYFFTHKMLDSLVERQASHY